MASSSNQGEPCAKQIVSISNGLFLELGTLQHVLLQDRIKDKKVCVVSIAGTYRQGKSFLLNFFVRYLTVTCKEKRDMVEWLTSTDGPITGFAWRCGVQTVTTGIWIWSEIFLSQLPSGEEVAVVLMDTQGCFDNQASLKSCASVFALSTLISSVQIYNLKDNIKSSDLDHLQFFLSYGKLLRQSTDAYPFQNLMFLIRDWTSIDDFAYGSEGGSLYLNSLFHSNSSMRLSSETISLIEDIKLLFQRMDCFLMPHPGLKVTMPRFSGNLADIDTDFKENVRALVDFVLSPRNLVPKVINGEYMTVQNLIRLFKTYCLEFRGNKMPKVQSLFAATANAQHLMALEEAEAEYDKEFADFVQDSAAGIEENLFLAKHHQGRDKAIEYFRNKRIMGKPEMIEESLAKLKELLDRKFKEYNYLNKIKLQSEQTAKMQEEFVELQTALLKMEDKLNSDNKLAEVLEKLQTAIDQQLERMEALNRELEEEKEKNRKWKEENESVCIIL